MTRDAERTTAASSSKIQKTGKLKAWEQQKIARILRPEPIPRPLGAYLDQDGNLSWKMSAHPDARPRFNNPPRKLCLNFAALAEADDETIRLFAKRWGPLNFKEHVRENVSEWRDLARLAMALLRFSANGFREPRADWHLIWKIVASDQDGSGFYNRLRKAIHEVADTEVYELNTGLRRQAAANLLNVWYREHKLSLVSVSGNGLQLQPSASRLIGVIFLQIAHTICQSDQTAVCSGCRQPFRPDRPVTHGVRQYCKRCRKLKIPERDAARDYRRRLREQAS